MSCQGKVGKIFFGKVRENEKVVPRDVRFSGKNASNSIYASFLMFVTLYALRWMETPLNPKSYFDLHLSKKTTAVYWFDNYMFRSAI